MTTWVSPWPRQLVETEVVTTLTALGRKASCATRLEGDSPFKLCSNAAHEHIVLAGPLLVRAARPPPHIGAATPPNTRSMRQNYSNCVLNWAVGSNREELKQRGRREQVSGTSTCRG